MTVPVKVSLFVDPSAQRRLEQAAQWLDSHTPDTPVLVLSGSRHAAMGVVRRRVASRDGGALFGSYAMTLGRLVTTLAMPELSRDGLTPASGLSLTAVCARVVHQLAAQGRLGRYQPIARQPGLPAALVRTIQELRAAQVDPARLAQQQPGLHQVYQAYIAELQAQGLADRAALFERATRRVAGLKTAPVPLGIPLLLLDVPIASRQQAQFIAAIGRLAPAASPVVVIAPKGDRRSLDFLASEVQLQHALADPEPGGTTSSLRRVQRYLFASSAPPRAALSHDVSVVSAPGESRECIELVRRIQAAARRGVPYDRIGVALRDPSVYRAHLAEALHRAEIPAWFGPGTALPHPSGRAIVALLACAAEGLSAARFAEYLSLGQCPDSSEEAPAHRAQEHWLGLPDADSEIWPAALERAVAPLEWDMGPPVSEGAHEADGAAVVAGQLRTPRKWERMLDRAGVVGGRDRWRRRLAGLRQQMLLALGAMDGDEPRRQMMRRDIQALEGLERFAMPLIDALASLPETAPWGVWLDALNGLARQALRRPQRVHAMLLELAPLASVGPVTLDEVRQVLSERLTTLLEAPDPGQRREGRVFVAEIGSLRGLGFDLIVVPGMCERRFPRKVSEDPILLDRERRSLSPQLMTGNDRVAHERLQLHLAVGAACQGLVLSYPRVDLEQGRPRVPSFYGLEVLRAAEGRLPDFTELARRAGEHTAGLRIAWPAPNLAASAIDDVEYDLATLGALAQSPSAQVRGRARYLTEVNPYLARALKARARRWEVRQWTPADGLIDPGPEVLADLQPLMPHIRAYSPTTLQHLAACPYRFLLHAFFRLTPQRRVDRPVALPATERGALIHDVQFRLLCALRDRRLLPLDAESLDQAWALCDTVVSEREAFYRDRLAPPNIRLWEETIDACRRDLRTWLQRQAEPAPADEGWTPFAFELAYGLPPRDDEDPQSQREPVLLDCGILTRGAIDLVERHRETGHLRATDHKTGVQPPETSLRTRGGQTLQPLLYALALEKLFPSASVQGGRLYFCTDRGHFETRSVALDDRGRQAIGTLAETLTYHVGSGFFPAAPGPQACVHCDYVAVCGAREEERVARKDPDDGRFTPLWKWRGTL